MAQNFCGYFQHSSFFFFFLFIVLVENFLSGHLLQVLDEGSLVATSWGIGKSQAGTSIPCCFQNWQWPHLQTKLPSILCVTKARHQKMMKSLQHGPSSQWSKILVILKNRICVINWSKDSEGFWTPVFGDSDQVSGWSWMKALLQWGWLWEATLGWLRCFRGPYYHGINYWRISKLENAPFQGFEYGDSLFQLLLEHSSMHFSNG